MASSFDYRALSEEEKQRILGGGAQGPDQPQMGLNLNKAKQLKMPAMAKSGGRFGLNLDAVKESN